MNKEIVLSGMRPTGQSIHLGNYFGAMAHFLKLQEQADKKCFFFIANWHAFTTHPDPDEVHANVLNVAADYLACGLDPEKVTLYAQSMAPETTEIALLLSNCISFGRLTNCTTFKEKAEKQQFVTAGLCFYPVLMAADILGPKAQWVPVGEDQTQHLEMAREMARSFNKHYGEVFPEPENIVSRALRVPGLDGSNKMGKSEGNTIQLDHDPDTVRQRMSVAVTDTDRKRKSDPGRPFMCNIFAIAEILDTNDLLHDSLEDLDRKCRQAEHGCVECKKRICESLIEFIEPIRKRKVDLMNDKAEIIRILKSGGDTARQRISATLAEMRDRLHTEF